MVTGQSRNDPYQPGTCLTPLSTQHSSSRMVLAAFLDVIRLDINSLRSICLFFTFSTPRIIKLTVWRQQRWPICKIWQLYLWRKMGTNQTKATGSDPGNCSLLGIWRRTQSSLRRRSSGERVGRVWTPPPYQRRVSLIQEVLVTVKAGRREEATELLKTLQQVSG